MGLGWGKLYITIERRPCFFRRKNSQSAIFTACRKNSHCAETTIPTNIHSHMIKQIIQYYNRFLYLRVINTITLFTLYKTNTWP